MLFGKEPFASQIPDGLEHVIVSDRVYNDHSSLGDVGSAKVRFMAASKN